MLLKLAVVFGWIKSNEVPNGILLENYNSFCWIIISRERLLVEFCVVCFTWNLRSEETVCYRRSWSLASIVLAGHYEHRRNPNFRLYTRSHRPSSRKSPKAECNRWHIPSRSLFPLVVDDDVDDVRFCDDLPRRHYWRSPYGETISTPRLLGTPPVAMNSHLRSIENCHVAELCSIS